MRAFRLLLPAALALCSLAQAAEKPRLVLVISIDQYRADYLRRFDRWYLPAQQGNRVGGFRFLASGANYVDGHHAHVPTATGPGHAAILTGSSPTLNGIIGNGWYDPVAKKGVYCVDDPQSKTVGGSSNPMSPRNLFVTTVGDELKQATNGQAKVVGISFKDRASILMAGHAADTVIWFDNGARGWVTSTFYDSALPQWVQDLNAEKLPEKTVDKVWEPLLPDAEYAFTRVVPQLRGERSGTRPFSHPMRRNGEFSVGVFTTSAYGNEYVIETTKRALRAEALGQDEIPDILAVNLATNDYIGHAYGPNSPEVMDISIRTDRLLSDLFNHLQSNLPGGLNRVAIVLTADHGVGTVPEEAHQDFHIGAERTGGSDVLDAVNRALSTKYGEGRWALADTEPNLYLDRALIASKGLGLAEVRKEAAKAAQAAPGVYAAFTYEQIAHGQLPHWVWTNAVYLGFHPKLAGDIMTFTNPGNLSGSGIASHGTPWAYDSHVPIVLTGQWFNRGTYNRRVTVMDIAPSLCQILGIEYPSGTLGAPLHEALDQRR